LVLDSNPAPLRQPSGHLKYCMLTIRLATSCDIIDAGFLSLPLPDQMNLLQSMWLDIICLNEAFRSVPYEGSIVFADDFKCSEAESKKFGIPLSLDVVSRKLAQKMTKMMVTTEEYVLLKTILLLNPGTSAVTELTVCLVY